MTQPQRNGLIRRRELLLGAGAGLGALALGGCGSGGSESSSGKVELRMFVFLGAELGTMPKEFAKEYEAAHPDVAIEIYEESNKIGYPKMVAAKRTTPDKPFVNLGFFNAQTTAQGKLDDMWAKLDYAAMPNAADVRNPFKRDDGFGIGIGSDQVGLLYNTERSPEPPRSWSALWDPAYRDHVVFFGFSYEAVLMAAQLNGGSLQDLEPGWELWEKSASQIRTLVSSNPQYLNVMSDGTGWLTSYFNGTGNQWTKDGAPIAYAVPDEGAISTPVYLQSVAANTPRQQEVCEDIINEMLSPKWCARWAETSIEVPGNRKAKLPADLAKLPAFQEETIDNFVEVDFAYVGEHLNEWNDRWERDIATKI